jgi:N-acetylglucosaminyldiphosphoundecaprenol N-acetyl-beta-D-mannosaminyltransferase
MQLALSLKRALDMVLAAVVLLLTLPLTVLVAMLLKLQCAPVLSSEVRLGRFCVPFSQHAFAVGSQSWLARCGLAQLPTLWNVLVGEMSFIGPRAVGPNELSPRDQAMRARYNVPPGFICLWWIRRRANIAYDNEAHVDAEYVATRSLRGDLGIAFRALPALLFGEGIASAPDELELLGLRIDNLTMDQALQRIVDSAMHSATAPTTALHVAFVNADCANIAYRDLHYRAVLRRAGLVLADGIGLKLAGRLLGRDVRENVNGTDLFPRLCQMLEQHTLSLYLLGARPGVARAVAAWVEQHYPQLPLAGYRDGYFVVEELPAVIAAIQATGARVLLVALGAPRQDVWLAEHLTECGAAVGIGVGGLFDFYSGRLPRAPLWMREVGMEWSFRLLIEPRRMWRRYIVGNNLFLWRVLLERLGWPPPASSA